jgi:predicted DCC family thiol-disulfide oxidoreductase YuxK
VNATRTARAEQGAGRGCVYFDAECPFCVRGVARWGRLFERAGFRWVPLQTPGAAARLDMSDMELRAEMKLLLPGGRVVGGVDAWAAMLRVVWWLWPLGALLAVPGIRGLGRAGYRWLARNRHCLGGSCASPGRKAPRRNRHAAFFELP